MWGYIGCVFAGVIMGFIIAGLVSNKSPEERRRDDDEQAECMKKLAERMKSNESKGIDG